MTLRLIPEGGRSKLPGHRTSGTSVCGLNISAAPRSVFLTASYASERAELSDHRASSGKSGSRTSRKGGPLPFPSDAGGQVYVEKR